MKNLLKRSWDFIKEIKLKGNHVVVSGGYCKRVLKLNELTIESNYYYINRRNGSKDAMKQVTRIETFLKVKL